MAAQKFCSLMKWGRKVLLRGWAVTPEITQRIGITQTQT